MAKIAVDKPPYYAVVFFSFENSQYFTPVTVNSDSASAGISSAFPSFLSAGSSTSWPKNSNPKYGNFAGIIPFTSSLWVQTVSSRFEVPVPTLFQPDQSLYSSGGNIDYVGYMYQCDPAKMDVNFFDQTLQPGGAAAWLQTVTKDPRPISYGAPQFVFPFVLEYRRHFVYFVNCIPPIVTVAPVQMMVDLSLRTATVKFFPVGDILHVVIPQRTSLPPPAGPTNLTLTDNPGQFLPVHTFSPDGVFWFLLQYFSDPALTVPFLPNPFTLTVDKIIYTQVPRSAYANGGAGPSFATSIKSFPSTPTQPLAPGYAYPVQMDVIGFPTIFFDTYFVSAPGVYLLNDTVGGVQVFSAGALYDLVQAPLTAGNETTIFASMEYQVTALKLCPTQVVGATGVPCSAFAGGNPDSILIEAPLVTSGTVYNPLGVLVSVGAIQVLGAGSSSIKVLNTTPDSLITWVWMSGVNESTGITGIAAPFSTAFMPTFPLLATAQYGVSVVGDATKPLALVSNTTASYGIQAVPNSPYSIGFRKDSGDTGPLGPVEQNSIINGIFTVTKPILFTNNHTGSVTITPLDISLQLPAGITGHVVIPQNQAAMISSCYQYQVVTSAGTVFYPAFDDLWRTFAAGPAVFRVAPNPSSIRYVKDSSSRQLLTDSDTSPTGVTINPFVFVVLVMPQPGSYTTMSFATDTASDATAIQGCTTAVGLTSQSLQPLIGPPPNHMGASGATAGNTGATGAAAQFGIGCNPSLCLMTSSAPLQPTYYQRAVVLINQGNFPLYFRVYFGHCHTANKVGESNTWTDGWPPAGSNDYATFAVYIVQPGCSFNVPYVTSYDTTGSTNFGTTSAYFAVFTYTSVAEWNAVDIEFDPRDGYFNNTEAVKATGGGQANVSYYNNGGASPWFGDMIYGGVQVENVYDPVSLNANNPTLLKTGILHTWVEYPDIQGAIIPGCAGYFYGEVHFPNYTPWAPLLEPLDPKCTTTIPSPMVQITDAMVNTVFVIHTDATMAPNSGEPDSTKRPASNNNPPLTFALPFFLQGQPNACIYGMDGVPPENLGPAFNPPIVNLSAPNFSGTFNGATGSALLDINLAVTNMVVVQVGQPDPSQNAVTDTMATVVFVDNVCSVMGFSPCNGDTGSFTTSTCTANGQSASLTTYNSSQTQESCIGAVSTAYGPECNSLCYSAMDNSVVDACGSMVQQYCSQPGVQDSEACACYGRQSSCFRVPFLGYGLTGGTGATGPYSQGLTYCEFQQVFLADFGAAAFSTFYDQMPCWWTPCQPVAGNLVPEGLLTTCPSTRQVCIQLLQNVFVENSHVVINLGCNVSCAPGYVVKSVGSNKTAQSCQPIAPNGLPPGGTNGYGPGTGPSPGISPTNPNVRPGPIPPFPPAPVSTSPNIPLWVWVGGIPMLILAIIFILIGCFAGL